MQNYRFCAAPCLWILAKCLVEDPELQDQQLELQDQQLGRKAEYKAEENKGKLESFHYFHVCMSVSPSNCEDLHRVTFTTQGLTQILLCQLEPGTIREKELAQLRWQWQD